MTRATIALGPILCLCLWALPGRSLSQTQEARLVLMGYLD